MKDEEEEEITTGPLGERPMRLDTYFNKDNGKNNNIRDFTEEPSSESSTVDTSAGSLFVNSLYYTSYITEIS